MRQILQGIMQRIQRLHALQPFRFGIPDLIADLHLAPRVIPFQNEDFVFFCTLMPRSLSLGVRRRLKVV